MMTIGEVSRLTGLSIRTLHHYDAIGLLHPSSVTEAGYRRYDNEALCRLQQILLFRELRFPLRDIRGMLENPLFDAKQALTDQIALLEMERARIDDLLLLARNLLEGGTPMDKKSFSAFSHQAEEAYRQEAANRWGSTEAWQESARREAHRSIHEQQALQDDMAAIFAHFGTLRDLPADAPQVREAVLKLQSHITTHHYHCTREILSTLGLMYTSDERFTHNIDQAGGLGTAAFVSAAISSFCKE